MARTKEHTEPGSYRQVWVSDKNWELALRGAAEAKPLPSTRGKVLKVSVEVGLPPTIGAIL